MSAQAVLVSGAPGVWCVLPAKSLENAFVSLCWICASGPSYHPPVILWEVPWERDTASRYMMFWAALWLDYSSKSICTQNQICQRTALSCTLFGLSDWCYLLWTCLLQGHNVWWLLRGDLLWNLLMVSDGQRAEAPQTAPGVCEPAGERDLPSTSERADGESVLPAACCESGLPATAA